MNILMCSSEALPFSKTGGLADVVYALSKEIAKKEKDDTMSIISPFYGSIDKKKYRFKSLYTFNVKMNWRSIPTEIMHVEYEGIDYYLVKNDNYFARNGGLYGYYDDGERFAYFSLAVIELIRRLPYEIDVVHCHDWQTGMVPCLLKEKYSHDTQLGKVKTVLTIHNPLFKGYFGVDSLYDFYELDANLFYSGKIRLDGQVSTLKAGIWYADKITTVSPTHAYELKTPDGSKGLWYDLILRQNDFCGILNGMDYKEFNPAHDKLIYKNYNQKNFAEGKRLNKKSFCEEFELEQGKPLYSVVSRLSDQKGLELINAMADFVVSSGGNFAIVGSGEKYAEDYYNALHMKYLHNVRVYIGYNNEMAHKCYAASDFFIMPSAFEPCGLGQMIAQRYGTLPIVRRTGGLKDSVIPYNYGLNNYKDADGFGFDNFSVNDALKATALTLMVYNSRPKEFEKMRLNALKADHSWTKPSQEYLALYHSLKSK